MDTVTAPIVIFYHAYIPEGTLYIYEEQMALLQESGLMDACDKMFVTYDYYMGELLPISDKQTYTRSSLGLTSEVSTLTSLYNYCAKNECNVLYFHTKGSSRIDDINVDHMTAWRKYMEYFNILKWEDANKKLEEYDTYGVELVTTPFAHYSGNFWWATSKYINSLNNPLDTIYRTDVDRPMGLRHNQEFWIGTGGGSFYSGYLSNYDLYYNINRKYTRNNN